MKMPPADGESHSARDSAADYAIRLLSQRQEVNQSIDGINGALGKVGLQLETYAMLREISAQPMVQYVLAERLGLGTVSVSRWSDLLSEMGYLERCEVVGDRRRKLLTLTSLGEEILVLANEAISRVTQGDFHESGEALPSLSAGPRVSV